MKLRDYGAKQICSQEYRHWRETGVAFTFPEFEYILPNKTFAMDLRRSGNQWFHRGYVGDMTVGPFIPFGIECVEDKMMKSTFGTNTCRATDITERNIYEMMFEIEHKRRFNEKDDKKSFRQYGAVKLQVGEAFPTSREFEDNLNLVKYDKPLKSVDNVKIHFMSVEDVLNITKKHQFQGKFDIVLIANNYFSFLKPDFTEILSMNSLLLFETKKYSILKQSEINDGIQEIKSFCKDIGLQPITSFALNIVNSLIKFKKVQ